MSSSSPIHKNTNNGAVRQGETWEKFVVVDILSKRTGPRKEDVQIKRIISENQATITRLADHLSGGAYSARRQPQPQPQPQPRNLVIVPGPLAPSDRPTAAHLRISPNGRVVLMDGNSGRQMHHLGDLRHQDGVTRFRLATAANGYVAPLDPDLTATLSPLDGQSLPDAALTQAIEAALGLA